MGKTEVGYIDFLRGHIKVMYMKPLITNGGKVGIVYRFWGGHRKVEYLKILIRRWETKHIYILERE